MSAKLYTRIQKNHCENDKDNEGDGYMPEIPGNLLCPVLLFQKYLEKLNQEQVFYWRNLVGIQITPLEKKSYNSLCRNWVKNASSRKGTQITVFG